MNLETQDDVSSIEEFRYLSRGDVDQRLATSGHHPAEIPTSVLQQELTRDSYGSVSPLEPMQPLRRSTRLREMQLRRHELQMAARDVPVTPVASRRRRRSTRKAKTFRNKATQTDEAEILANSTEIKVKFHLPTSTLKFVYFKFIFEAQVVLRKKLRLKSRGTV